MATVVITEKNFTEIVEHNSIVLIDFWAGWCSPCMTFRPVFDQASEKHPDIVFATLNVQDHQVMATAAGITSVPALMVVKDQKAVFTQAGALPPHALEDLIARVRLLDVDAPAPRCGDA